MKTCEKKTNSYNHLSRIIDKLMVITTIVIFIGVIPYCIIYFLPPRDPYNLDYFVRPYSISQKILQVDLTINNYHDYGFKNLEFYKGEIRLFDCFYINNHGEKLAINEKNSILKVKPGFNRSIQISYKIKLGRNGKHGYRGQMYEDFITFDGEHTLLLPLHAYMKDSEIIKYINNISIKFETPKDWNTITPFTKSGQVKKETQYAITEIRPTWYNINNLKKSNFTFGKFEEHVYRKGNNVFIVYVDSLWRRSYSSEVAQGLNALYDYYVSLFKQSIPRFSLVLLRNDPKDNLYIMGGASSQTLGATFNPENLRDWELLGHRLFHAFFDTRITNNMFYNPPNLWFYEGLATYYENVSINNLPQSLKSKLRINLSQSFVSLFERYLYMRFKDPAIFSITPMEEKKIMKSLGKVEFLHYTQAPLIVKTIEDYCYSQYGSRDVILKYIMDNYTKKSFNLNKIIDHVANKKTAPFLTDYIYGNKVIPLWHLKNQNKTDSKRVIEQLNYFEYLLSSWFTLENPNYPRDQINSADMKTAEIAKEYDLPFAPKVIEVKVNNISPTVYQLLKLQALRAKICKVKLQDPLLRYKLLLDKNNLTKWESFKKKSRL